MPRIAPVSGRKVAKVLGKAGFQIVGQRESHIRLKKKVSDRVFIVVVPLHPELKRGTLKSILRQAGLTAEEFTELLEK
ncbi:MAG: type II toxin-antitoxin system HicA family toxin [Candidatus Bathyarchaeia archaeon]